PASRAECLRHQRRCAKCHERADLWRRRAIPAGGYPGADGPDPVSGSVAAIATHDDRVKAGLRPVAPGYGSRDSWMKKRGWSSEGAGVNGNEKTPPFGHGGARRFRRRSRDGGTAAKSWMI